MSFGPVVPFRPYFEQWLTRSHGFLAWTAESSEPSLVFRRHGQSGSSSLWTTKFVASRGSSCFHRTSSAQVRSCLYPCT